MGVVFSEASGRRPLMKGNWWGCNRRLRVGASNGRPLVEGLWWGPLMGCLWCETSVGASNGRPLVGGL